MKPLGAAVVAALGGYSASAPFSALAQEQASGGTIETVIVTAARREQNLQDVPLSVVAITAESMETQGIENMEDLNAVVPNVVIAGNNVGTDTATFVMRGIPNVGLYVDGIWQVSNNGLLLREFVELDRVEVLSGPQGTLYGRDSTGGAIRIYTRPPGEEFGGKIKFEVGNLDRRDLMASVDIPFSDNFRSRFSVGNYDREGYITSITTGQKTGGYEDEILRADFYWTPSDRVSLRFNAQSDEIVSTTARVQTWIEPQIAWNSGFQVGLAEAYDIASGGRWNCMTACSGWPGGQLGEWEGSSEITVPSRTWIEQQTIDLNVDVSDNIAFQYLYGDTFVDNRTYNDWDSGPFNFYIDYFNNETELASHEFQFTGGNDRFTWVAGAYMWDQEGRARNPAWSMREWVEVDDYGEAQPFSYVNDILTHPACTDRTPNDVGVSFGIDDDSPDGWPVPCDGLGGLGWVGALAAGARPPAGDRLTGNDISGFAYFGEVTIRLAESFDLTLGYRYHDQEEDQFAFDVDAGVAAGITAAKPLQTNREWESGGVYDGIRLPGGQHVEFDADTFRVAGSWHVNDDIMLYAGYTEGFNSGGLETYIDSLGPVELAFDPEQIENNEIGIRSDLLGGRLRLNATYFITDWIGVQLPGIVIDRGNGTEVTELVTQNAASAEASGFEFALSYAATDRLLLQANIGLLDTKYTDSQSPAVTLNTEFSRAPDETYNLGIQYDADLSGGGNLSYRLDASYTGGYWRSSTPSLRRNAYGVPHSFEAGDYWNFNGRVTYTPSDSRYEVSLYGTNLTNDYHLNSGFLHNIWQFDFATVDRPREVGVGMTMFF
ncbi:MAG: TonB-dependent receptor [Gammaproteobacteria bacterium]|nr:TonB-dependent receptor [Gammaproteobacteria bacterium]